MSLFLTFLECHNQVMADLHKAVPIYQYRHHFLPLLTLLHKQGKVKGNLADITICDALYFVFDEQGAERQTITCYDELIGLNDKESAVEKLGITSLDDWELDKEFKAYNLGLVEQARPLFTFYGA